VDASGKDGNASMPEEVKQPNPWRKMMTMTITKIGPIILVSNFQLPPHSYKKNYLIILIKLDWHYGIFFIFIHFIL
jgi:hypothetical protein